MLDETTYYITAFAVDSNNAVISSQQTTITTDFWWHPSANTLFYIKNDWEISDHSSYNHTMNWYWTAKYSTLSNWRKVLDIDWTNATYSNIFNESLNKTTFTMHIWAKYKQSPVWDRVLWWWCWRNKNASDTTDRWWARFQNAVWDYKTVALVWWNSNSWISNLDTYWVQASTSEFRLFTITINWWTYKIYQNWSLVWTMSSSTIRWWSSTWTRFQLWMCAFSDLSTWCPPIKAYIWEAVLEDKTESDAEVLNFYNKTKNHYV